MHPMLTIAVRAARRAGDIMLRGATNLEHLQVHEKSPKDYVSEIDQRCEEAIVETLLRAYPNHAILGEEGGAQGHNDDFQWIIDPLDGTTNFLHGMPQFAVSIALRQQGQIELGVVFDPMLDELFTAQRGGGAYLNNRRIRVSRQTQLYGALLGTGFPYRELDFMEQYFNILRELIPQAAGIRRPGSAALDLAYTAAGRYDGFWEFRLKPWDIAAGALLVREAGGLVSDHEGKDLFLDNGNIVAGTFKVHGALLQVVQAHYLSDKK